MLNRCPSCQASVLDDDAEACPFCGSPMDPAKAKGFKPAERAAPAAKTEPPRKPAAAPAARAPSAPKAAAVPKIAPASPDDDPFSIDRKTGSTAVALAPKRTQQRPHKVVCPMCDTPGYASEAASGKEVRCANPKCLVPVFKAPDFAAPKPAEPEPPTSSLNPTVLTFGAVGVILLGAAVWWFGIREPRNDGTLPTARTGSAPAQDSPDEPAPAPSPSIEQTPALPSPAEVLSAALARWPALADDIAEPQRQPLRRRYAAESLAIAGDRDAARAQIDRLAKTQSADPFYQISPLAELAWAEFRRGDEAKASAAFGPASSLASQIPRQGFDPARVAIDWAAATARFGQAEAARSLSRVPRDDAAGEQLLALLASAKFFNRGDLDAEYALRPVRPWREPKPVAVTMELFGHGAADAAKTWAQSLNGSAARAENLAAWGEATLATSNAPADRRAADVDAALASEEPVVRAYVHARGAVRLAADDQAAAASLLARVTEAAGALPAPEPVTIPDLVSTYRAEIAAGEASVLNAAILAEAAHAAALLGKSDEAADFLAQALDHLRASAPSSAAVRERARELETLRIGGVQSELKVALGLSSDEEAREAANAYRRKVQEFQSSSAARLNGQTELLVRAVGWGLGKAVLAEVRKRHAADDLNARDPYLAGEPGGRILAAFQNAGDDAAAQAVRAAGVKEGDVPPAAALESSLVASAAEKPAAIAQSLYSQRWAGVGRSDKLAAAVRVACRKVREGKTADALAFGAAVRDEAAREEVLRHLSTAAAASGTGGEIQQALPTLRLGPTEEASVLRGLVEGAVAAGAAPPAAAGQAAAATETP